MIVQTHNFQLMYQEMCKKFSNEHVDLPQLDKWWAGYYDGFYYLFLFHQPNDGKCVGTSVVRKSFLSGRLETSYIYLKHVRNWLNINYFQFSFATKSVRILLEKLDDGSYSYTLRDIPEDFYPSFVKKVCLI